LLSPKKTKYKLDWDKFRFEVTPVTSSSFTMTVASEKVEDTRFVLPDLDNPQKPSLGLIGALSFSR
jgi:hypothetical protein